MKKVVFAISLGLSGFSFSQKNVFIEILPVVGASPLQIGANHVDLAGTAFKLDHFDYYLSNLHIIHDGGQDLDLSDTVFLVEPTNYVLYLGFFDVENIEQINFGIGVPASMNTISSPTAVDITTWPAGHPLSFQDPSMYWGWSAGYMHMIVGGWSDTDGDGNADNTSENYFELHNLGNNNYASVNLPVVQSNSFSDQIDINVNCHLDRWLTGVNLLSATIQHGINGVNQLIMSNINTKSVFDQSPNAGIATPLPNAGMVYYSSDAWSTQLFWKDIYHSGIAEFIDASGRIIDKFTLKHTSGSATLHDLESGIYLFNIHDVSGKLIHSLKVIQQ
jgi:hypothetical protein